MVKEFFVESVYPNWKKVLRATLNTRSHVLIFFPYMKGALALDLLKLVPPRRCEIFTVCSIENFASGASCVQTFRELIESKYKLFHINRLHAKVVLVRGEYATLGSQNLTRAGTRNREVSIGLSGAEDVNKLEAKIDKWRAFGRSIDLEEIRHIETVLEPLKMQALQLRAAINSAQDAVVAAREERNRLEQERLEGILEDERRKEELNKKRQKAELDQKRLKEEFDQKRRQEISKCAPIIHSLIREGVSKDMAEDFIVDAGEIVRHRESTKASWMVNYVIDGPDMLGWRLDLSKNGSRTFKFLITRAILNCLHLAEQFANGPVSDVAEDIRKLKDKLRIAVRCSLVNADGSQLPEHYGGEDPEYVAMGINRVDAITFVRRILKLTHLDRVCDS
jgi:PLD-like domain